MGRIIIVSTLTIWSMKKGHGGPAFYRTIMKYINRGWDVYLVTDEMTNRDFPHLDKEHLKYVYVSEKLKALGQVRKLGLLFRWFAHSVKTRRYIAAVEQILSETNERTILYAYEVDAVEACSRLSKKYNLPLVTRFQGTILSQYQGSWTDKVKRYPHYQALATKADLVIMTDDGTQGDQVLQSLHNHSKMLFLRNGLDLLEEGAYKGMGEVGRTRFRSSIGRGVSDDDCMFLTVSRLVGWKRVDRAIEGFAKFAQSGIPGKLVIVGDGAARASLEEYAKFQEIARDVYFVGSVSHEKVYDYISCCDVFLSLYDLSNVGNPLLEAMTLGKCIVTYDVGNTRELIIHQKNGILLDEKSLKNLGAVMKELAADRSKREQYGNEAAKYAQKNFWSWEKRTDYEMEKVNKLTEKMGGGHYKLKYFNIVGYIPYSPDTVMPSSFCEKEVA